MVGLWVNVYRMINLNGAQEIEIRKINLAKQTEGSEKGLILEVDLEYPDELHEIIDDYRKKIDVTKDMLSNYCEEIRHKYNISTAHVKKLVPLLNEKEKYVLIWRKLEWYLDLGSD